MHLTVNQTAYAFGGSNPPLSILTPKAKWSNVRLRRINQADSPPETDKIEKMGYFVYVLFSKSYNQHYVGSTQDLEKRIWAHNEGLSRFTKGRRPWRLVYKEEYQTRGDAMKREKFLKSGQGREFIKRLER